MKTHEEITITITLKGDDDPVCDTSQTPEPEKEHLACWAMCENPRCYRHGCLNAIRKQSQEVQS